MRPLNQFGVAYPLLEISKGPFRLSSEGLSGFSLEGEPCTIRITDATIHFVEMRRGEGSWIAPEMGSVILLVPE